MPSSSCPRKRGRADASFLYFAAPTRRTLPAAVTMALYPFLPDEGAPTPHHGGRGKRFAPPGKVPGQLHQVLSHSSPPPSRSVSQLLRLTCQGAEASPRRRAFG